MHEVVLSSSYHEETFGAFIRAVTATRRSRGSPRSNRSGPAGDRNALEALDTDEPFLALNGDILTDLDLTEMFALHRDRDARHRPHAGGRRAPLRAGPLDGQGRVLEFREKPAEPDPGDINAGTYVLDPSALQGWTRGENVSIERQIFPALIAAGRPLYGFPSDAYWMDLGTPEAYLQAHWDLLDGRVGEPARTRRPSSRARAWTNRVCSAFTWWPDGVCVAATAMVEDSFCSSGARGRVRGRPALDPGAERLRSRRGRGRRFWSWGGAAVAEGAVAHGQRPARRTVRG